MYRITALIVLLVWTGPAEAQLGQDTVFDGGTSHRMPNLITEADPTALRDIAYLGKLERVMEQGHAGGLTRVEEPVFVFEVTYDWGAIEFQIHPDVGGRDAADEEVNLHAPIFGRVPRELTEYVREIEMSRLGRGAARPRWWPTPDEVGVIFVGADYGRQMVDEKKVEELYMHEGVHVSLEHEQGAAPGWYEAAAADEKFISVYARDNPNREDMAETFAAWFAVRCRPERISMEYYQAIIDGVPNRLAWFDRQGYDMAPFRCAAPVPALPAALTLSADAAPAEGGGDVTVTATLDEPAPADGTTVTLTAGGTATLDADYTLSSTTITIAESEKAGTITITVIDDAEDDDGETIVLDAESDNPALTAQTLTLTIEDNDVMPVPALPVGGVLLLGALLLWRGALRARGRDGGQAC